ncbi:hypothetical protein LCGC14_2151190 [marine sediment metagenome]|uniref:Uncharacterized protein n=1 Tax=marine sediment metagenome TaxID=412755 RepID=A0A0F9DVF9_9ZZZZ
MSALISACGAAGHAILPIFERPEHGKIFFGIVHSLLGLGLVLVGGYKLLEKIMSVAIAVMFATVLLTVVMLNPDWSEVVTGLFVPRIPKLHKGGLTWTIALTGGVGGTLTVLCYGYWIREKGRTGVGYLRTCRIDLGVAYAFTALFGLAMVIIGGAVQVEGKGADLVVALAGTLGKRLGSTGRWLFLIGAWSALFSSLLGVWQAVPYVFADFFGLVRHGKADGPRPPVDTRALPYRGYLLLLAFVPMIGLLGSFKSVQKAYAVFGALFMPMLAVALLILNGRGRWVGAKMRNRPVTVAVLTATVVLFLTAFFFVIRKKYMS